MKTVPFDSSIEWFFSTESHVAALVAEARSWADTPFRFGSYAKGKTGGAFCVGFVKSVMTSVGVVKSFEIPLSPADMSRHVHNDKVLNYLRGKGRSPTGDIDPQSTALAARFQELSVEHWTSSVASPPSAFSPPAKKGLAKARADARAQENAAVADDSVERMEVTAFLPGDILILKTGKGLWHMPVMIGPTAFMQCAFPDGVTEGDITASNYCDHLVGAFRARA